MRSPKTASRRRWVWRSFAAAAAPSRDAGDEIDLTGALGRDPIATPEGMAATARILDELLARRTVAGRPDDLADDFAWVRAASGRAPHDDPRLPLIG